MEFYLSQHREENDNHVDNQGTQRNTYYKETLPFFEEIASSFLDKHLFDDICQLLRNRHMVHIASRGINDQLCNLKAEILFGENNNTKRAMKKHTFIHKK